MASFCEVKTRRAGGRAGGPFDAVGRDKQARVRKMAGSWLVERRDRPYADVIRFDAIGVIVDADGRLVSLEHLEGAFYPAMGRRPQGHGAWASCPCSMTLGRRSVHRVTAQ